MRILKLLPFISKWKYVMDIEEIICLHKHKWQDKVKKIFDWMLRKNSKVKKKGMNKLRKYFYFFIEMSLFFFS